MPNYKLIAVDVDGTLLTSGGAISERTKGALRRAVAGGATLAVATGRRRRTAQPIVDQLELPHFLVASQGAIVWEDGSILAHSHLPAPAARGALEITRRHGMATVILGNALVEEVMWVDGDWQNNERLASYLKRNLPIVRPFSPQALDHDPVQFIVMDDMERLECLDEALTGHRPPPPSEDPPLQEGPSAYPGPGGETTAGGAPLTKQPDLPSGRSTAALPRHAFADGLAGHPGAGSRRPLWRVIFSRNQFSAGGAIEVVGPDTSKASALAVVCRRLAITPDQVIAFGDNVNDVEMLEFAGLGVAMGNSTADARAVARRIAPSNDEDGIAVTLEALGLA